MSVIYIFLTFLMFVDCVILVLLVLLQLPKKDAGAGLAFGSGATDALFGAGSGNVLTKITKYAAGIFFVLAIVMAMASSSRQASLAGHEQVIVHEPFAAHAGDFSRGAASGDGRPGGCVGAGRLHPLRTARRSRHDQRA